MIWTSIRANLNRRPLWMNGLFLFCAYMTFVYVPWDMLSKPLAQAEEVWFGILLSGWQAKITEPLHLAIYGAGFWGFLKMKSWMHPWAALYAAQIAVGMLVWNLWNMAGYGITGGLLTALPFAAITIALWRSRHHFQRRLPG